MLVAKLREKIPLLMSWETLATDRIVSPVVRGTLQKTLLQFRCTGKGANVERRRTSQFRHLPFVASCHFRLNTFFSQFYWAKEGLLPFIPPKLAIYNHVRETTSLKATVLIFGKVI